MEGTVRPKLDHFVGRTVEGIVEDDDQWGIALEGNVTIWSGGKIHKPKTLDGKMLTVVMLDGKETRLSFMGGDPAQETVTLDAMKYTIETEDWEPFNPQQPYVVQEPAEEEPVEDAESDPNGSDA